MLHELWPKTRGVLLALSRDVRIGPGRYLCQVAHDGHTAERVLDHTAADRKVLTAVYPCEFEEAPRFPLHDGTYALRWHREAQGGLGWAPLTETAFRRENGRLVKGD